MIDCVERSPKPAMSPTRAMRAIVCLFFAWGFLTNLNDVLSPHLRATFGLSFHQGTWIQCAFFGTFFLLSYPSGRFVEAWGYKSGMVAGLLTMATGCLLFAGATYVGTFPSFLPAVAVLAAGITMLQTSAGPYVSLLGPESTASSRFSLALGFNSLGTLLSLPFGSWSILSKHVRAADELAKLPSAEAQAYRTAQAATLRVPYLVIAIGILGLAGIMLLMHLPAVRSQQLARRVEHAARRLAQRSTLIFGALAMVLYVGAEVSVGSFLIDYLRQPFIAGLDHRSAALRATLFWIGAAVGRVIGWAVLRRWRPSRVLIVAAGVAGTLALITVLTVGSVAAWSILAIGLFNSVMVPIIFNLSIEGLGELTARGSGVMVMAVVGGALVPLAQGLLADRIGLHHALLVPVFCYAFIVTYAMWVDRRKQQVESGASATVEQNLAGT